MSAEHDRASTAYHTRAELDTALEHLVPAMSKKGLQILSDGHVITLLPGRLTDRLADELAQQLRLEQMRRDAERKARHEALVNTGVNEFGFRKDAVVIGAVKAGALQ